MTWLNVLPWSRATDCCTLCRSSGMSTVVRMRA
jgi:hypothetical protein